MRVLEVRVHVYVLEYLVIMLVHVSAAGLQFLSGILPLEAEGTAGLKRRHGRAALRGISRALALLHACTDCRGDTRA